MAKVFRHWRQLTVALAVVAAVVFGYINALDERMSTDSLVRTSLNWAIGPIAVLVVYLLSVRVTRDSAFNYTEAVVLSWVYAMMYAQHAFNGPSWRNGPDNAAHMHLVLEPLLIGVPALFVIGYMLWTMVRRVQSSVARLSVMAPPESASDEQMSP